MQKMELSMVQIKRSRRSAMVRSSGLISY